MERNEPQEFKPVVLAQLPGCFGKPQIDCLAKCQVWESCIRRQGIVTEDKNEKDTA